MPRPDSVRMDRSFFLRHALPFALICDWHNPTRRNSAHCLRIVELAFPAPLSPCLSADIPVPASISNRNSAAIRNWRNLFIQKEKTFSNRNKKQVFRFQVGTVSKLTNHRKWCASGGRGRDGGRGGRHRPRKSAGQRLLRVSRLSWQRQSVLVGASRVGCPLYAFAKRTRTSQKISKINGSMVRIK